MRILRIIFVFLIESNLFIALSAALITFSTQLLFHQQAGFHPYLFIIFFATFFDYNLHRLYTLHFAPEALKGERHAWLLKNKTLFYILMFASSAGFLISLLYAKTEVILSLIPFAAITVFYSIPFIRWKNKLIRLRDLPYLKIVLIAGNWTAITILLPLIQYGQTVTNNELISLILERFFFMLALCMPFDIRDIDIDRRAGLKTIPNTIGIQNSLKLAYLSLIISMIIAFNHFSNIAEVYFGYAIIASAMIAVIAISNAKSRLNNLYLYGLIDGLIFVQSTLIIAAHLIHQIY